MATWNIHINSYASPICGGRENPNFEYRNSKQIQMTKISMTKTRNGHIIGFLFRILKIRISILFRISHFAIRIFKVVHVIWWHDKLPKSGTELLRHDTSRPELFSGQKFALYQRLFFPLQIQNQVILKVKIPHVNNFRGCHSKVRSGHALLNPNTKFFKCYQLSKNMETTHLSTTEHRTAGSTASRKINGKILDKRISARY